MTQPAKTNPADGQVLLLPATGTWPEDWYLLDQRSQDAILLAQACGRPLLIRGLPGTGKSDLARAAAEFLGRAFVYEVITARTEPQDLLWRFDAIARLADAQVKGTQGTSAADPGNPLHYVSPGVMWWSLHWRSADRHLQENGKHAAQRPDPILKLAGDKIIQQMERAMTKGCVLLLDEIDKADSDLPNSLLEVLANRGFRLPWGSIEIPPKQEKDGSVPKPLIVVTTNEDRELPAAFVRRCLVLNLEPVGNLIDWIKDRARVHFRVVDAYEESDRKPVPKVTSRGRPPLCRQVLEKAAEYLGEERQQPTVAHKPGLAEFLDLLHGLAELAPGDEETQLDWLKRVYGFAYIKRPPAGL